MNRKKQPLKIAIVGGGASGLLVCSQLFQLANDDLDFEILWFEKEGNFGRGKAYSTQDSSHLLNVRASGMSAFPDQPLHFFEWARQKDASIQASDFLPRLFYGEYLESLRPVDSRLREKKEEVLAILPEGRGFAIRSSLGKYEVDQVVLALGNLDSAKARIGFLRPTQLSQIKQDAESIVIIGTGLTMVDTFLSLKKYKNLKKIIAVSRRGLLPECHATYLKWDPSLTFQKWREGNQFTLLSSFRIFVKECKLAEKNGSNWRAVFDLVRSDIPKIWKNLSQKDRERFLRHVCRYWDVHRHRVDAGVFELLKNAIREGSLEILSGTSTQVSIENQSCLVEIRTKDKKIQTRADGVVDCTGLIRNLEQCDSPLLKQMLEAGLLELDQPSIGVQASRPNLPSLHLIGPLLRGRDWESIAIPEIRVQAEAMVRAILK